jgi:hypothetical protein
LSGGMELSAISRPIGSRKGSLYGHL